MDHSQLIIMRHATAGLGGSRDHDRPLTQHGIDEAARVGQRLRAEGPVPTQALVSSALRCRETWQAVSAGLGASPPAEFEDALYNASCDTLLEMITGVVEPAILLLIAHNPGVSVLAHELSRADPLAAERLRAGFTPGTTACLEIEGTWSELSPRTARLIRFEPPPRV